MNVYFVMFVYQIDIFIIYGNIMFIKKELLYNIFVYNFVMIILKI